MSLGGRAINDGLGNWCSSRGNLTFCDYVYGTNAGNTGKIILLLFLLWLSWALIKSYQEDSSRFGIHLNIKKMISEYWAWAKIDKLFSIALPITITLFLGAITFTNLIVFLGSLFGTSVFLYFLNKDKDTQIENTKKLKNMGKKNDNQK